MGYQVLVPAELVYLLNREISPVRSRHGGLAEGDGERREGVRGESAQVPVRARIGTEVLDDSGAELEILVAIRARPNGLELLPCRRALASRDSLAQRSRTCLDSWDR